MGDTFHVMMRIVDASKVRGRGATRNVCGASEAMGELLAFSDADDVVQPGWLMTHALALAEADISAGVMRLVAQRAGRSFPVLLRPAARYRPLRLSPCGWE